MLLLYFSAATCKLVRCRLTVLLVFLHKIDLCFLSAWSNRCNKAVPAPFSKGEFKQFKVVGCGCYLFPLCPVSHSNVTTAVAWMGRSEASLSSRGGHFGALVSLDAMNVEGRVSEQYSWHKHSTHHHLNCSVASKSGFLVPN